MANIIVDCNYFSDNKLSPEISNHDSVRDNSNPLNLTRTLERWIKKDEKSVVINHNKDTGMTQLNQDTLVTHNGRLEHKMCWEGPVKSQCSSTPSGI